MTEKQGRNEIEYRLSLLKLNELLELKLITSEEYKKMQKKLLFEQNKNVRKNHWK